MDVLKKKYADGGMAALSGFGTKGLVARIAHVALTTMLMKTLAGEVYKFYSEQLDYAD